MKCALTWPSCILCFVLALAVCLPVAFAFDSFPPPPKRSKSDRDINAIGHRQVAGAGIGNWYSPQKEKELGGKYSAAFEKSIPILHDAAIDAYIDAVAKKIAQNSDATLPITVHVVNSAEIKALTLPGGYLYVTSGLLMKMQNEGELASVLARGIAHTALHTFGRALTRAALLQSMGAPLTMSASPSMTLPCWVNLNSSDLGTPLTFLHFCRGFEFDADYFGVQYLYKAGYDPDCFVNAVDRLRQLRKEILEILPRRDTELVSNSEFGEFQDHLRTLMPPEAKPQPQPMLIHLDSVTTD